MILHFMNNIIWSFVVRLFPTSPRTPSDEAGRAAKTYVVANESLFTSSLAVVGDGRTTGISIRTAPNSDFDSLPDSEFHDGPIDAVDQSRPGECHRSLSIHRFF